MSWHTTRRVEFQHCDPAGIVFYPRYFEMINSVIEEFFRDPIEYAFGKMHAVDRKGVPTAKISVAFQQPGFLDDVLDFQVVIAKLGNSSLGFDITCTCLDNPRFTAQSTIVQVDMNTRRSTPWPDKVRAALAKMTET